MKTVFIVLALVSLVVVFIIPVARTWRFAPYVYWASWGLGGLFCFPVMPTLKASIGMCVLALFCAGYIALRWHPWLYGSDKPGLQYRMNARIKKIYTKDQPRVDPYEKPKRQDS